MQTLQIFSLGPLRISGGKAAQLKFESNKVRALLVYLIVENSRPHNREMLAEMLWPEGTLQSSMANLRYALADLRKVIGDEQADPPYLFVSRENLQFNSACNYELDLVAFTEWINSDDIEKLKQGVALYNGDFLSGFPSIESDPFEEWVVLKREDFKRQVIEALQLIADHHEQRGEFKQALPFARRQVELEPWLEEAHQQLMRILALDGQRSAALAQYETCRLVLASELDVEPTHETTQLYESIRAGKLVKVPHLLKRDPPAPGEPPYKGLHFFNETDADLFFGREALVSHLVELIHSREKTVGARFLAIIGASGSGKSSLVRAGLIPALKRDDNLLLTQVITPTELHLETLSDGLKTNSHRLIFVDQFEELFTLCHCADEQKTFIDKLLDAAQEFSVVIALRADFYAACAPFENLRKLLSQNQVFIGPMNADELRRAIEGPAQINGWLFEPSLVDLLLQDTGADRDRSPEPGALPLLSHALLETWHRRSGRMLTLAGYAETGKISQAITQTAESVFTRLSPEEQSIARNIFLRLTELGEGTQETRRRVQLSEIIPPPESDLPLGKTTETVLKLLSDARLIITTEATAEVAHEALIREWDRLHEWLAENREALRIHRRITVAALEWDKLGRDLEVTLRGTRLAQAIEWAETHSEDMNILEREFLDSSMKLAERESAEREARRQRELEAAQQLAESERQRAETQARTARQLRQRAFYLAGILLIALVMAFAAFMQRNTANRQAHLASARELALASINNLEVDAELSILLASQAVSASNLAKVTVPYEVQDALHRALQNFRLQYTLAGHKEDVLAVAFSPDGNWLVTASSDGTAIVWEAATGKELMALRGHTHPINDIAISPDGKILATASDDRTVKIWDVESGRELRTLNVGTDIILSVSFSEGGEYLATAGELEAKIWSMRTGDLVMDLDGHRSPVTFSPTGKKLAATGIDGLTRIFDTELWEQESSLPHAPNALAFSPDGKRLATAELELKIWDVSTGEELASATGFTAIVTGVEFSPDGYRLATGGQDGTVILWDTLTGKRLFNLAGHSGAVNDVSFNPTCVTQPKAAFAWCGGGLATASRDGTARMWDVSPAGSRELATLPGFTGGFLDQSMLYTVQFTSPNEVEILTWHVAPDGNHGLISSTNANHAEPIIAGNSSPNGMRFVTVDLGNMVKVWKAQTGELLSTFGTNHTAMVSGVAFNTDGTHIATSSEDGTAKVWDAVTGRELLELSGDAGPITGVAFNPEGTRLATASVDGSAKVWDVTTGNGLFTLPGHTLPVFAIAYSLDGKRIATASMDLTIEIWDAETGKNLHTLSGHKASVISVSFSPDGSRLASGSYDATTRIWDTTSGEELLVLTGHDGWVGTVIFSPNGKHLAAGSFQDGTMRVYALDVEQLAALAQSRLTRSLTLEECQKYLHQETCP